jgi:hypothetical protein
VSRIAVSDIYKQYLVSVHSFSLYSGLSLYLVMPGALRSSIQMPKLAAYADLTMCLVDVDIFRH